MKPNRQSIIEITNVPKLWLGVCAGICCLALIGCEYAVPITSGPTRGIDKRLLGNWVSSDGKNTMKVRRLDDSIYIVSFNGYLFRAYHSDIDDAPLASVQDIDSSERKYCYRKWNLTDDGRALVLHSVNNKVVPKEIKDSGAVQQLLRKHLNDPELYKDETRFTKKSQPATERTGLR